MKKSTKTKKLAEERRAYRIFSEIVEMLQKRNEQTHTVRAVLTLQY